MLDALKDPPRPNPAVMPRQEYLRASPPMFESRVVDALTRVPVWVVPLIYVPAIAHLDRPRARRASRGGRSSS